MEAWLMRAVRVVFFGVLAALGGWLVLLIASYVPGLPTAGLAGNLLHALELGVGAIVATYVVWYLVARVSEHDMPNRDVLHSLTLAVLGGFAYLVLVLLNRTTTLWDLVLTLGVCAIVAEYVRHLNSEPVEPTPERGRVR